MKPAFSEQVEEEWERMVEFHLLVVESENEGDRREEVALLHDSHDGP